MSAFIPKEPSQLLPGSALGASGNQQTGGWLRGRWRAQTPLYLVYRGVRILGKRQMQFSR